MKKIFLALVISILLCIFAMSVSAARVENYEDTFALGNERQITHYEKWLYNDGKSAVRKKYSDNIIASFIDEEGNAITEVPMWEYDEEDGKYYSLVWYISDYELFWEDMVYSDSNVGEQIYPKYTSAIYTLSKARAIDLRYVFNQYNTTHDAWKDADGNKIAYSLKSLKGIYHNNGTPDDTSDDIRLHHAQGIGRDSDNYGYYGYDAQFKATGDKIVVGNFRDCDFERDEEGNYGTANTFSSASNLQCIWLPDTVKYWVGGGFSYCYEIDLGEGIEVIACQILRDNSRIKEFVVPNSVIFINNEAFRGTDLTKLTIGEGVVTHGGAVYLYTGGADYAVLSKNLLKDTYKEGKIDTLIANQKAVVYFDGNLEEAQELFAKIKASNSNYKNVGYYDYTLTTERASTNELSIFYNYNTCEAFYRNVHNDDKNPCVINCERCGIKGVERENPVHNESIVVIYTSFDSTGIKKVGCTNEGCKHYVSEELPRMFSTLGYSASEDKNLGIVLGYQINKSAITYYEEATGKKLDYGVFAASKEKLGSNDIFTGEGASQGVVSVDMTNQQFSVIEIKITGITENQKDVPLALGAYVLVNGEYSYLQSGTPSGNDKYYFITYNQILNIE